MNVSKLCGLHLALNLRMVGRFLCWHFTPTMAMHLSTQVIFVCDWGHDFIIWIYTNAKIIFPRAVMKRHKSLWRCARKYFQNVLLWVASYAHGVPLTLWMLLQCMWMARRTRSSVCVHCWMSCWDRNISLTVSYLIVPHNISVPFWQIYQNKFWSWMHAKSHKEWRVTLLSLLHAVLDGTVLTINVDGAHGGIEMPSHGLGGWNHGNSLFRLLTLSGWELWHQVGFRVCYPGWLNLNIASVVHCLSWWHTSTLADRDASWHHGLTDNNSQGLARALVRMWIHISYTLDYLDIIAAFWDSACLSQHAKHGGFEFFVFMKLHVCTISQDLTSYAHMPDKYIPSGTGELTCTCLSICDKRAAYLAPVFAKLKAYTKPAGLEDQKNRK